MACHLPMAGQTRRYDFSTAHGVEMTLLLKSRVTPKLETHQATRRYCHPSRAHYPASPRSTCRAGARVSFAGRTLQGAVIPAEAGIHTFLMPFLQRTSAMDSRPSPSRGQALRGNDCDRGVQDDTSTQPTRTSQNWHPYERTQHVIENKAQEISEPSMLMKILYLTLLTQQVYDGRRVIPKSELKNE